MMKLSDEERRALEELARHPDGCAEAALVADGSTIRCPRVQLPHQGEQGGATALLDHCLHYSD
jgi:hypothetical protein